MSRAVEPHVARWSCAVLAWATRRARCGLETLTDRGLDVVNSFPRVRAIMGIDAAVSRGAQHSQDRMGQQDGNSVAPKGRSKVNGTGFGDVQK